MIINVEKIKDLIFQFLNLSKKYKPLNTTLIRLLKRLKQVIKKEIREIKWGHGFLLRVNIPYFTFLFCVQGKRKSPIHMQIIHKYLI